MFVIQLTTTINSESVISYEAGGIWLVQPEAALKFASREAALAAIPNPMFATPQNPQMICTISIK